MTKRGKKFKINLFVATTFRSTYWKKKIIVFWRTNINNQIENMKKNAPGWGKAIGIIMICLGGLGTFYQIYKIIFPSMINNMTSSPLFQIAENDMNRQAFNQFSHAFGLDQNGMNLMILFGVLGTILLIFYIIAGAKLLTVNPKNYYMARNALLVFVFFNAVGCILFFTISVGFFLKMILIYSIVGLVFDIALLAILLSSNKAAYGIGVEEGMESYTLDSQDEEVI